MGALLDHFADAGVQIECGDDAGTLRVHGPLTDALRASIRGHKAAILAELAANDAAVYPDVERRGWRVLAMLAEQPERHIAILAEPGDPAHVTVAIRDVAVGELTIAADRYDGFALLALMNEYGHA